MKFMGYRRPDGTVGIRNHVLIMATVGCAAEVARKTADGLYGAVSFINQNGCGETAKNLQRTRDIIVGLCANPNIYGVVAIGLGCELNKMDDFLALVRQRTKKPIEGLLIQQEGGTINTIAKATHIAQKMITDASTCMREECDISELMLGVECGGSDATSGLVANPVMGLVSDRLIGMGGISMFSETMDGNRSRATPVRIYGKRSLLPATRTAESPLWKKNPSAAFTKADIRRLWRWWITPSRLPKRA